MLNKVTGYTGFQSYGILPYPHLKPGKKTLDSNEIWQKNVREIDHMNFYDNYKNHNTIYNQKHIEPISPTNFENPIKVKNPDRVLDDNSPFLKKNKSVRSNDRAYSHSIDNNKNLLATSSLKEKIFLASGTEHWQTSYDSAITDPYSYTKSSRPLWSLNRPPYTVDSRVGPTEYMKQIGEKGTKPIDKLNKNGNVVRIDDPLRMGTSQVTEFLPGYTGFIPAAKTHTKAYEHGQGKVARNTFLKENILENYHTRIPGYAGHQPSSAANQKLKLRSSCFSLN